MDKVRQAKNYLDRIKNKELEVQSKQRMRDRLREEMLGLKASRIKETSVQESKRQSNPFPEYLDKTDQLEKEINQSIDELVDMRAQVYREVDQVTDARYKAVLIDRHFNYLTWEQMCEKHYRSNSQIHRDYEIALIYFYNQIMG